MLRWMNMNPNGWKNLSSFHVCSDHFKQNDIVNNAIDDINEINLDLYDISVVEYLAGSVVRNVAIRQTCDICFKFLNMQDRNGHMLTEFKEKYILFRPQKSLIELCRLCETEMKVSINSKTCFIIKSVNVLIQKVLHNYMVRDPTFFTEMYRCPGHDAEHRYLLAKQIVSKYLAIRCRSFAKLHNEESKKGKIRSKLNKLILFNHQ